MVVISPTHLSSLRWINPHYVGAIFIPPSFYLFIKAILRQPIKRSAAALSFILAAILLVLLFSTRLLISDVKPNLFFRFYTYPGPLYFLFILYFFGYILYSHRILVSEYKHQTAQRREQIKYVILATVLGFGGGTFAFFPVYNLSIPPYGIILTVFYPFVTTYAIVRYNLMNIRVALTRASIFIVVYIVVLGLPFWITYKLLGIGPWFISLFIIAVLASAGPFIYSYFQRKAENRLRREEFEAHKALNRLAQEMLRFTSLNTLLNLIVHQVLKILRVKSVSIYLKGKENDTYSLRASWCLNGAPSKQSEFSEDSLLVRDLLLRKSPVLAEEIGFNQNHMALSNIRKLQAEMAKAKAAAVVPAFKGDELFGFMVLGPRREGRLFTQEDLYMLLLLTNQTILAIENAQLFEKEKTLLAEKSRRDALADMAPGVAHQFDNRLQSISLTAEAQMLLSRQQDLKKLNPDELISTIEQDQKAFDSIAKDAIRGKEISDAVRNKGRAKLTLERQALLPIIQGAISRLRISRTKESLRGAFEPEITIDSEEGLPELLLQQSQTDDVFYNLLDNARDAIILRQLLLKDNTFPEDDETSYQGKIAIKAFQKDEKVIVTVSDNGIGIKEKQLKRLFVPWFTTKATSIKGAGMGLSAIQSVIEDHKGRIKVESEYGKGTTFTIEFPINPAIKAETNHDKKAPDS